jgi:hypothetical protein
MIVPPLPTTNGTELVDPTQADKRAACAMAEQFFLAAARDESHLSYAAHLHCLLAAETLAVATFDADMMAASRASAETASAEQLIRDGLRVLSELDHASFTDPRIKRSVGYALRALRGVR